MDTKMIGTKIAQARKENHISQAKLAGMLFISPQAVGKWERGESIPDIVTVNRLAEIFGVSLNYFSGSAISLSENVSLETTFSQPVKQASKRGWNMSDNKWVDADFSGLKGLHEKFNSTHMQQCKFAGADLSGLLLKSNDVDSCDFTGSIISNSRIQSSHFKSNVFKNSQLTAAEFLESDIRNCDFSGADFTSAVITKSAFRKNIIENTIWQSTFFNGMHIADITFNSTINNCSFDGCAFANATFQNLMLYSTFFKCKNLKGLRFVNCQADRITYEFLKNGKADLNGLTLLPANT